MVSNNYFYITAGEAGLRKINISNRSDPIEESFFNTGGDICAVAIRRNYAFIADY